MTFDRRITITLVENWKHYNQEDYDPELLSHLSEKYRVNLSQYEDRFVNNNDISGIDFNSSYVVELGQD